MDLSIYNIIVGPVNSDKARVLSQGDDKHKKILLQVNIRANRVIIKQAVQKIFDVKVKRVNTHIREKVKSVPGKRGMFTKVRKKYAIITLDPSSKIDLYAQTTASGEV